MISLNKEFLSGLVESTDTIVLENGEVSHPLTQHISKILAATELAINSQLKGHDVWRSLLDDTEIKEILKELYPDSYEYKPLLAVNSLVGDMIYKNADFLNRIVFIFLNDESFAPFRKIFEKLKNLDMNSADSLLFLLKMSEIIFPLFLREEPAKEWVVDYREIEKDTKKEIFGKMLDLLD